MTFAEPLWFLLLLVVPLLFFLRQRGYLGFSDNRLLQNSPRSLSILAKLPKLVLVLSLVALVAALARPQIPGEPEHRTIPGRDIILAVDISFSMSFEFKGDIKDIKTPEGLDFQVPVNDRRRVKKGLNFEQPKEGWQRIHASQRAMLKFIANRWENNTGDRMGIVLFDVVPRYGWPITDDLRMLYRKAQFISNNLGTGTNFGDQFPGPIDLAAQHFKEYGEAKSRVLIMVTDGEVPITYQTQARLAQVLQEEGIRFYLIGIGETLAQNDVDIIKFANRVGGRVYRVEDTSSLDKVFTEIDRLEKSEVTISELETRDDIFYIFAWIAAGLFGFYLLTEATILRR